jgi:hypothetical protein
VRATGSFDIKFVDLITLILFDKDYKYEAAHYVSNSMKQSPFGEADSRPAGHEIVHLL